MFIKPEQLDSHFTGQVAPLIWVSGDEHLLVQECCDKVLQLAVKAGFSERETFHVQASSFDWQRLLEAGSNLSLFAEKKLLDLRLQAKPDKDAQTALQNYLENPGSDNLLLVRSPKIDKATTGTKWFKAIETRGLVIQLWPMNGDALARWLARRLLEHGLQADEQAIQVLMQRTEGNLLAAAQEIEKLGLLLGPGQLDAQTTARAVADSARFNVFALLDACLAGQAARALNILAHLQAEDNEALQILNMLCKEIRMLSRIQSGLAQGRNISALLQEEKVWSNRSELVRGALHRHNAASLGAMLDQARLIDHAVKGLVRRKTWDELSTLVLQLAAAEQPLPA